MSKYLFELLFKKSIQKQNENSPHFHQQLWLKLLQKTQEVACSLLSASWKQQKQMLHSSHEANTMQPKTLKYQIAEQKQSSYHLHNPISLHYSYSPAPAGRVSVPSLTNHHSEESCQHLKTQHLTSLWLHFPICSTVSTILKEIYTSITKITASSVLT